MKKYPFSLICIFLALILSITSLHAQSFQRTTFKNLSIEPVVGYERTQKIEPTARTSERYYYGARARYGVPLLSAELEVTQAKDSERFSEQDLSIEEDITTIMLGLRSSLNHQGFISLFARAGGHYRKREIEKTQNGVKTLDEPSPRISPYAGAGLQFRLSQFFSLNAGYTVIFTGEPRGSDRDYQTSLGFTIGI